MENLASKYRPKTLDDMTEQSVIVDIVRKMCDADELSNRNLLFIGPAGTGKALPLDEPVLTCTGFKKMGMIKEGEKVVTHTGAVGIVTGVFPQGKRPIYKITLKDGAYIRVSDNHLNIVNIHRAGHFDEYEERVITTDRLIASSLYIDYSIPVAHIDDWVKKLGLLDLFTKSKLEDRKIVNIEYCGEEECQCIYVDHPDHSFIAQNFIPTHNTTTARIIGNMLNEGKGEPIEIDAASHSGVDAVREIISNARTYPVGTKYKLFIIDECHALSNPAWQSLLKTLEEQPARSIFCLCTTNPEKIPATVLSRVQTFQLSKISLAGIFNRLKFIVEQEIAEGRKITYTDEALMQIAKIANGGMRDGITSLDQCLSYSEDLTIQSVIDALDLPNYDDYFELLNAIVKKDNQKIVDTVNTVYNSGANFVKWFDGFFSFIINIVKYIYLQDIDQTIIPPTYKDKIAKYGVKHSAICLKLSNTLVQMNKELKTTQYLQELAISYLCTPPNISK